MQRTIRVNENQLLNLSEKAHYDHSLAGYLHKRAADSTKWQPRWFVLYQKHARLTLNLMQHRTTTKKSAMRHDTKSRFASLDPKTAAIPQRLTSVQGASKLFCSRGCHRQTCSFALVKRCCKTNSIN
ncbi:Ras-specific guanine nucleotide-releasing factor 1 [Zootermopsis nevadensis]|uniref:Ras-specific guanine nucleotide-releasing factor 1 n=1 Tax=Zootermopsis nevadensis TaxID=136037 RepID=A0A067QP83_ZOONE|nr:Ras-specific guanine nucleotide-releasing factor 1 [Zootermopsis nevadensis]